MSPIIPSKRYFVYALAHPNGRIFYIGKGTKQRPQAHLKEARKGHCICPKCRVIHGIWKERLEVVISYIFQTDDEGEAYEAERRAIYEHRRNYQLCNVESNRRNQKPRTEDLAANMTLAEYISHLDHFDLTKVERKEYLFDYGLYRVDKLKKQWRLARRTHQHEEAARLAAEIESVNAAAGVVTQHRFE